MQRGEHAETMLKFWAFMTFLAAVSIWDGRTKRIPNWLILGGAAAAVLFEGVLAWESGEAARGIAWESGGAVMRRMAQGGGAASQRSALESWAAARGAGLAALRMLAAMIPGLALFRFRVVGAGDVKLAAVIVGFMGVKAGGTGIFLGLCLGAAWSLARMVRRGIVRKRFLYLIGYVRRVILTGEIEAYYVRKRDGEEEVIPLGVCLGVGAAAVMILVKCNG